MSETVEEYVARISGISTAAIRSRCWSRRPRRSSLRQHAHAATLAKQPAPGKWSIQEILAHLADVEIVLGYRVRRILETDGVAIDAYDQNRWAAIGRYAEVPVERVARPPAVATALKRETAPIL